MAERLSTAVVRVIRTTADELFINQSELSRRTGIPQPTISRAFSGETVFSLDQLEAICKALNLSMLAVIDEAFKSRH